MNPESMPDVHIEGESVIPFEAKVKLWKDITRGALKFSDLPENQKRNEQWVEFLRNILDKMGADAYGYVNESEGEGEISYMVLHPEKAKSLFSKGFDITKQEMGKYRGGQVRPMYDGGMVQHMAHGGGLSPGALGGKKENILDESVLREKQRQIQEAKGTDKLWGPEERKYIEGIRKGDIDDPDFLRTYKATQKGLGHYTEEEVKSMGMEDPFLPAASDRTTVSSRAFRKAVQDEKVHPLVLLGGDPRLLVTSPEFDPSSESSLANSAMYMPGKTSLPNREDYGYILDDRVSEKEFDPVALNVYRLMEEGLGMQPSDYDKFIASLDRPERWYKGDVIVTPRSENPRVHAFHEFAHRGLKIIEEKYNMDVNDYEHELFIRLIEYKYFRDPDNPEKQLQETREFVRNNYGEDIDKLLKRKDIKKALNFFLEGAEIERKDRGFPTEKIQTMYDGGIVPSSTKPMYDGGLV